MNYSKIESHPDCEVVFVRSAVTTSLTQFLDESVPWVWLLGHYPNRIIQWWNTTVPLNSNNRSFTGNVRNLSFDLQLKTEDFLDCAFEFDEHGLTLIQSKLEMPDTLNLRSIPDSQQNAILIQNGATLRIDLPHAIETAQVQSFQPGYLATKIC